MSVAFRSATEVDADALTFNPAFLPAYRYYYDVDVPAGLTVGDVMIMGSEFLVPLDPAWISAVYPGADPGEGLNQFYKRATSADVTAGTIRLILKDETATTEGPATVAVAAYSGVYTVTVNYANLVSLASNSSAFNVPAPDATARAAESRLAVRMFCWSGFSGGTLPSLTTPPAGTTTRAHAHNTSWTGRGVLIVDKVVAAGSVGTATAVFNAGSHVMACDAQTFILEGNHAPDQPVINTPGAGSAIADSVDNTFRWTYSDIDPGDEQSAYDFRYSDDGGMSWTVVSDTTADLFVTIPASTFTPGLYEAQVRSYDQAGAVSVYSASLAFTVVPPPTAPTIADPIDDDDVSYTHTVIWVVPAQEAYEIRRIKDDAGDPDPSVVYYDSGLVASSAIRSVVLTFPTNSRDEHIQVRVFVSGIPSEWTDVFVHVAWVPPGAPTMTLTTSDTSGAIQVDLVASDDEEAPPAVYCDLFVSPDNGDTSERLATGLDPTSTFIWWTPASEVDYSFQVIAYAADGSPSISEWIGSSVHTPGDITTSIIDGGGP